MGNKWGQVNNILQLPINSTIEGNLSANGKEITKERRSTKCPEHPGC
jgi:hypothetical protein